MSIQPSFKKEQILKIIMQNHYKSYLNKLIDQGKRYLYASITYLREQLVGQLRNKIERLENFVDLIRTEIIEQVKEIQNNQNQVSKRIIDEMKGLEWDLQDKQDDLMNGKLDYRLQAREVEQSGITDMIYQYSLDISEDKTIKQVCKTQQLESECKKLASEFELIVLQYNEFVDVFKTKMESYLTQMEEYEQERLLVQKDTLMKLFMFEASISKKELQDSEKLNEQIRKTNLQDVIENFIMKYQRPQDAPRQLEFRPYSSFLTVTVDSLRHEKYQKLKDAFKAHNDSFDNIYDDVVKKNVNKYPKQNIQTIEQQELEHLLSKNSIQAIYKIIQVHINCVWNANEIPNNDQIQQLLRQSTQNRLLWCQALEVQANKNNFKVPSQDSFEQILRWSQTMINFVPQFYNQSVQNALMYPLQENLQLSVPQYYLMQSLQDQKLFQSGDFIEATIVEATYDALVEEIPQITQMEERIRKQKINFLTQLSKICFTLLLYNPKSVVKMFAENYLKNLAIAQDASENLLYQIESYEKQ